MIKITIARYLLLLNIIKNIKNNNKMRSSALILFACAGLLLSGGTILGGTVAWNLLRMSYYFWTTDLGVEIAASVLFVAGSLLCFPTCWLATLVPHAKTKTVNIALLGVVTVAILLLSLGMSSISALSRAVREPATLNTSMLRAMSMDSFDPAVKNSFTAMQLELRCCGVQSFSDWFQHRRTLPSACCGRVWNGKRGDSCDVPLFSVGCLRPALVELRAYANTLAALSSALVIIMAVTLCTTLYILITNELGRGKIRSFKPASPLRIGVACLSPPCPTSPHVSLLDSAMPPVGKAM